MFSFNERKRAMRKEIQKELKIRQLIQQEHEKSPHVPIGLYREHCKALLCYRGFEGGQYSYKEIPS